ncbi:MAG: hypothetical protein A2W00_10140 [Candidatus Eisenbacteria bacterium RBG_16_71_46]|nr:MAG: hypothetical protein A2W00_10140 [Candidatus Eisenbacteria bacterium RBG_16_71_46]
MTTSIAIKSRGLRSLLVLVALLVFGVGTAGAATITIVNNNAAGVGFNDPTPVAPVGGNPGTTLGAQRLFVFQHAANIWGSFLTSNVVIQVRSQFAAQTCTATSAVLGSAGAVTAHRDFAGADFAGTWYGQALANKLAGVDLDAVNPDINATFNLNIDSGCFGPGLVWYYGIDGNEGVNIELLPVVLHEMAHGLGFQTFTSGTSGNFLSGFPTIYDRYLFDNTNGLRWYQMTAAQRVASAINTGNLVWDGSSAVGFAGGYLAKRPRMLVNSPGGIAGTYTVQTASFGPALTAGGLTGNVVLVDDGTGTLTDACEPLINGAQVAGNIALIDRGICTFVAKTLAAQAAGAIGVIIANNAATGLPGMGGSDPSITIPAVGISQADGNLLKANLGSGVNVTLGLHPTLLAGADNTGKPLMYAPSPYQSGSSVSHWDVSVNPNALMEPAINVSLHDDVDLTPYHFKDIGWFPGATATFLAMFTAENRPDGILLKWSFGDPTDVGATTLERALSADGPWAAIATELGRDGERTTALDTSAEPGTIYFYRLRVMDRSGHTDYMGLTSARREALVAGGLFLSRPSPNPTSRGAQVTFRLAQPEFVRLSVVDVGGRKIRTLHEGMMLAGDHTRTWDGRTDRSIQAGPGVYFITLQTSEGVKTERMSLAP